MGQTDSFSGKAARDRGEASQGGLQKLRENLAEGTAVWKPVSVKSDYHGRSATNREKIPGESLGK